MCNSVATARPCPTKYAAVEQAAERLSGVVHRSPVLTSRTANDLAGARLFFKSENFQRAGAFKFRGAFNAIACLPDAQRKRGVVTYSSGNHAQAIALAGRLQDVPTTIIMPKDAPAMKVRATEGYGGTVHFYDRYRENREEIGVRMATEQGLSLIPPYDHPDVIAGQGTVARELFEDAGPLDALFVPLGGGGLLAGCALACHALSPRARIIGVEPAAGNDGQQSLRAGRVIEIPVPRSIADGAVVTHLGGHNFPIIKRYVSSIVTVKDEELVATMRFFAERMKIMVEPTGCLAAAAVLSKSFHKSGERIGIVLSGGNVDLARFAQLIGP